MKLLSIIVAVADNNAIGKDNKLLWHLPEDLKQFKKLTENHKIIMGSTTYESLPRRPLPNRTNIVLSSRKIDLPSCIVVSSIQQVIDICDEEVENFVIGGASIYRQFLPFVQKIYLTKVYGSFEADTYFPDINFEEWEIVDKLSYAQDEKHLYTFDIITYKRINL